MRPYWSASNVRNTDGAKNGFTFEPICSTLLHERQRHELLHSVLPCLGSPRTSAASHISQPSLAAFRSAHNGIAPLRAGGCIPLPNLTKIVIVDPVFCGVVVRPRDALFEAAPHNAKLFRIQKCVMLLAQEPRARQPRHLPRQRRLRRPRTEEGRDAICRSRGLQLWPPLINSEKVKLSNAVNSTTPLGPLHILVVARHEASLNNLRALSCGIYTNLVLRLQSG